MGLPWESGGTGPHAYNCWGLMAEVQRKFYNRKIPLVQVDAMDLGDVLRVVRNGEQQSCWKQVKYPRDGDVAVMGHGSDLGVHVGVWVNVDGGGILHCDQMSGVIFTKPYASVWQSVRYFEFQE